MRPLLALFSLSACAPALRLTNPDEPIHRHALAGLAPGAIHRVLGVELWVHDSDPSASKPTLLCLHAIGHGGSDFARLEAAFGATHRILTVDWPGHGRSGADSEPVSAARYARLLEAFFIGTLVSRFEQGVRNEARFEPWFRAYYANILVTDAAATQRERIVLAGYEHAALLAQA